MTAREAALEKALREAAVHMADAFALVDGAPAAETRAWQSHKDSWTRNHNRVAEKAREALRRAGVAS